MKIKCINKDCYRNYITIGKTYEVVSIDVDGDYNIIDNTFYINWYEKEYFIPLSEIRNETINKLLEDES